MPAALKMIHDADPKAAIMAEVGGYLDQVDVLGTSVLLAVYIRPEKTAGGVFLPQNQGPRKEDQYQGKVGLVLKKGPAAFVEDDAHRFGSVVPQIGDWVAINVGDTWPCELGRQRCRVVEDVNVKLILAQPDIVW